MRTCSLVRFSSAFYFKKRPLQAGKQENNIANKYVIKETDVYIVIAIIYKKY